MASAASVDILYVEQAVKNPLEKVIYNHGASNKAAQHLLVGLKGKVHTFKDKSKTCHITVHGLINAGLDTIYIFLILYVLYVS